MMGVLILIICTIASILGVIYLFLPDDFFYDSIIDNMDEEDLDDLEDDYYNQNVKQ